MKKRFMILSLIVAFLAVITTNAQCKRTDNAARAVFAQLTAQDKVDLWRTHLQTQLDERSLNKAQREVIRLARELITVEFYEAKGVFDKATAKKFAELKAKMLANFSAKEGSAIFETLSEYNPVTVSDNRPLAVDCNCSTLWTFCPEGWTCHQNGSGCAFSLNNCIQVINCGPFWGFQCNGYCCAGDGYEGKPNS